MKKFPTNGQRWSQVLKSAARSWHERESTHSGVAKRITRLEGEEAQGDPLAAYVLALSRVLDVDLKASA